MTVERFIPTPVGNTPPFILATPPSAVHPHARGEHTSWVIGWRLTTGSSPRPWGTLHRRHARPRDRRFIPTPVGNTRQRTGQVRFGSVHPHARGEHLPLMPSLVGGSGSSPRSWGTRRDRDNAGNATRFIPTLVGNTFSHVCCAAMLSVHPHARGEHWPRSVMASLWVGSSPRSWGTPQSPHGGRRRWRFIPTLVGNTLKRLVQAGQVVLV